jgi:hypothetical protein
MPGKTGVYTIVHKDFERGGNEVIEQKDDF